jgi:hypothetical protein
VAVFVDGHGLAAAYGLKHASRASLARKPIRAAFACRPSGLSLVWPTERTSAPIVAEQHVLTTIHEMYPPPVYWSVFHFSRGRDF